MKKLTIFLISIIFLKLLNASISEKVDLKFLENEKILNKIYLENSNNDDSKDKDFSFEQLVIKKG